MMEKPQQETSPAFRIFLSLFVKRQKRGLGQGHQLKPECWQALSCSNQGYSGDSAPNSDAARGGVGQGTERGTLAHRFLLPSSLLPGPPIGQTQKEASWWESLGNAPMTAPFDREQNRTRARMALRAKWATSLSQREDLWDRWNWSRREMQAVVLPRLHFSSPVSI